MHAEKFTTQSRAILQEKRQISVWSFPSPAPLTWSSWERVDDVIMGGRSDSAWVLPFICHAFRSLE